MIDVKQDEDALIDALHKKQYRDMCDVAFRLVKNRETAEDLVQDAFLLAVTRSGMLLAHPAPEAWLMKVLKNKARNKRRRHSEYDVSLDEMCDMPSQEPDAGLAEIMPFDLTDEERQILSWRFEERLSSQEMAKRLGISEAGCRSRVSRAVKKCERILRAAGQEADLS